MTGQGYGSFRPERNDSGDGEDWITTYADAITLLMAFFVMMFSVSTLDAGKFKTVQEAINAEISHRSPPEIRSPRAPTPFQGFLPQVDALADVEKPEQVPEDRRESAATSESSETNSEGSAMSQLAQEGMVSIERSPEGVTIEFASAALFQSGSGDVRDDMKAALDEVSEALLKGEFSSVEVEGHTDDIPINTARFPSNWELSTTRATSVVRYFIDQGVPTSWLSASGFADIKPKLTRADPEGRLLSDDELRGKNRRVVIRAER